MKRLLILLCFFPSFVSVFSISIVYGPYLQSVGEKEATIVWVTDKPAVSWVEITQVDGLDFYAKARDRFYNSVLGNKEITQVHRVKVTGLDAGKEYEYRALSKEVLAHNGHVVHYGEVANSYTQAWKNNRFMTCDRTQKNLRFSVVNDLHEDLGRLRDLLDVADRDSSELLICNGDMLSHFDSQKQLFDNFLNVLINHSAKEKPFYMVRGNHETRGAFARNYMDYFPSSTTTPYYSFMQGPVYFLVLDGGEDKPDTDVEYYERADFDNYRREQAAWLEKEVQSDDFKKAAFKVVMIHVPPTQSSWHGPLHTKELFVPILNKAGIDLMIAAHNHEYHFAKSGTEGCQFPLLINSDKEVINVDVSSQQIRLQVKDRSGKTLYTHLIKRK